MLLNICSATISVRSTPNTIAVLAYRDNLKFCIQNFPRLSCMAPWSKLAFLSFIQHHLSMVYFLELKKKKKHARKVPPRLLVEGVSLLSLGSLGRNTRVWGTIPLKEDVCRIVSICSACEWQMLLWTKLGKLEQLEVLSRTLLNCLVVH